MTIVTVDSPDHHNPHLNPDTIPIIDLRFLSQSELTSLSLHSSQSFNLHRCDDIVIPKIDRSVFNESAGSRKQTYSRLRLAPRKSEISAVGRGRYNPVPKPHTNPVDDPERKENKQIVSLLRELFGKDTSIHFKENKPDEFAMVLVPAQPLPVSLPLQPRENGLVSAGKRKRGRPRKDGVVMSYEQTPTPPPQPLKPASKIRKVESGDDFYENVESNANVVMEIVNKNGVVVDLAALGCSDDPYGPELTERSVGLTTEEELLVLLRGLKGQWGSRRKKRKVVDACDFGDALPIGWKLLLSLRRKEGSITLYCRRYISPTGQQFASCKEVSSYLLPFFGFQGETENHPNSFQSDESDYEAYKLSSGSSAGLAYKDESTREELIYDEASPVESSSSEHEKQLALLGTENLAEVEIKDLLECHICKTSFDEKDAYLQHLLSSHQKSAKRLRHSNTSVCDGVIIKDGKYECQFCHKIFDERHRYNGHVGIHVRNYVRSLEPPGGTTMQNNVKPSSVSSVLPGFSGVETSDKGSVPLTSIPTNETTVQKKVKASSRSRVLPTSDDHGSVPRTSKASDETTMQIKIKASSVSGILPGFSGVEASVDIVKGSVPPSSIPIDVTTVQNNVKASSVSRALPGFSGAEASTEVGQSSVSPSSIPINEITVENKVKPSSVSGVLSGFSVVKSSATVGKGSVSQTFVPSNKINIDSPCAKMDADSCLDVSTSKPNFEQTSRPSKTNTGIYIPQFFLATPHVENVDSPHDNLGSGSIPENSTSTSSFELSVGSSCGKHDILSYKIDEPLGGESGDKRDSDIEMTDEKLGGFDKTNEIDETLGDESDDEQDSDIEMTDRVYKTNNNLNVDLRSCLGSTTAFCNNVEDETPETFEERNFFATPTVGKLGKVVHTNSDLDGEFRLCLGSATALRNTVGTGANLTYEGNNVFTSSAVGINLSGLKQGEGSFSFSFDPSGSEKTNGVGICSDEIFSLSMKMPELDKGKEYGFNEQERYFATNISQSNQDSLIESMGSADKETILQRLVADTSSPLLHSSGCFPTLDLMPIKGQGESENFPLQKFDNMSGFEELGFDDLEPSKFGFVTGKESSSLAQEHLDLSYDSVLEEALNNSAQFEWEPVLPKIDANQQQRTICVWCRTPFDHEAINPDMQSDSVGFMCPACKAKISGQLNVLDNFGQL